MSAEVPNPPVLPSEAPVIRTIAMPSDTNPEGDIFGGWLMSQMDLAGATVAFRLARGRCATIAVDGMAFLSPVSVGDEVSLYGRILKVGRTSVQVMVEAWRRRRDGEAAVRVTEGVFTYVAIDLERRPRPIASEGPGGVSADLETLRAAFSGRLLTAPEETAPFLVDWRKAWHGAALAVVQPDTAQDVAAVVAWCAANRVPITPQGGNTGLSGGATPDAAGSGIVLSLARLNRIRAVDPLNNTMTVEAGCILANVHAAAAQAGRFFPLSLASEGSCTIGGNLSTNAGGVAVLRYGNARDLCLGLEVATAQGELWDGLRGLRKDNTGYDLRDLYIGSEGTLGIITAAVLKLFPAPAARTTALAAVESPRQALRLLELAQARLGPALTAFELESDVALQLVLKHFPDLRSPLAARAPWYVLVEVTDLASEAAAVEGLEAMLAAALEAGVVVDAAVSSSLAQSRMLWALRENIAEAQAAEGKNLKHDISVPISRIADFVDEAGAALIAANPDLRLVVFGHLGDGNLHFNVNAAEGASGDDLAGRQAGINRLVHDRVTDYGGSISAEHGLGVLRRDEAARYKPAVELALMRTIKQALDPLGLMNPGKVLG